MSSPDQVIRYFFSSLGQWQFPTCWRLFSTYSQQHFMKWTLDEVYKRHQKAASSVKLGLPEIKFMFEDPNEESLIKIFWQRFAIQCRAKEFIHFGYFEVESTDGKTAQVRSDLRHPDGRVVSLMLTMVREQGGWRFGYLESGFKL